MRILLFQNFTGRTRWIIAVSIGTAGALLLGLLVFVLGLRPSPDEGGGASGLYADCWGCGAYLELHQLFDLQVMAAEPRVRQIDEQLTGSGMTESARDLLIGQRVVQGYRLDAAIAGRAGLTQLLDDCLADVTCREGPGAFQALTCTGPWPSEDTQAQLTSLAARIYDSGAGCRDMACPTLDCAARGDLQGALDALTATLGAAGSRTPGEGLSHEALNTVLPEVREVLERLPLVLSVSETRATLAWADQARGLAILQPADEWRDRTGPDAGWRLRLIERHVQGLIARAEQEVRLAADWRAMAQLAGAAMAQVRYLEDFADPPEPSADAPACESLRTDVVDQLTSDLRRAAAAMSVCGARSGCDEAQIADPLADILARAPSGLGGLDQFVTEAEQLIERRFAGLALSAETDFTVATDLSRYGHREAVRVSARPASNRCIAEPGARYSIVPAGKEEPVAAQGELLGLAEDQALIAAPQTDGEWEVRVFAAPSRGGAELARETFEVAGGLAFCDGFAGVWETNFGELHLFVRDGVARGTYRRSEGAAPGFLVGEVRGPVLFGEWSSELGRGGARLELSDDGTRLSGGWSHIPGRYAGTGRWTGECAVGGAPAP